MTEEQDKVLAEGTPSKAALGLLRKRFRLTDMNHPAVDTIFKFVVERLPTEEEFSPAESGFSASEVCSLEHMDPLDFVQMEVSLPSIPTVFAELQAITKNSDVSSRQVSQIVSRDPGLTAWLLKLVNSPFYGFSVKIDTISRAVALLGVEQIRTLSMSGVLQNLMGKIPPDILDSRQFWRNSLCSAVAAYEIGKLMGNAEPERLFVAGLLHDCGILALAHVAPQVSKEMNILLRTADQPRYLAEQHYLGFDHARLGGMLLHRWNMPLSLVMTALRHHQVEAPERYIDASVVHLADFIAFATSNLFDEPVPPLDPAVWDVLGLSCEQLNFLADLTLAKTEEMSTFLG